MLALKQNRATYLFRGAYWNETAYSIGALIKNRGAYYKNQIQRCSLEREREREREVIWNKGATVNKIVMVKW